MLTCKYHCRFFGYYRDYKNLSQLSETFKIKVSDSCEYSYFHIEQREKWKEKPCKRPIEVEVIFGQLKSNNRFHRLTLRGLSKVEMEFLLMAIGYNFRKLHVKMKNVS